MNWPAEVYGLVKEQLKLMTMMKTMPMMVKRRKMARGMDSYEIRYNYYQGGRMTMPVTMGKYHGRQHITKFLCYLDGKTPHIVGQLTILEIAQKRNDEMC